jgi:hypothetical protein
MVHQILLQRLTCIHHNPAIDAPMTGLSNGFTELREDLWLLGCAAVTDREMSNYQMRACRVVFVISLLAGVAGAAVHGQTVHGTPADERAIRDLVPLHASSSQKDDLDGLVAGLHVDADSRRADSVILSGRAAIEQRYRGIISSGPKRMAHAHPSESIRIRFLQPDVAFVDVDSVSVDGQAHARHSSSCSQGFRASRASLSRGAACR